ncbi:TPA: hypothetical protein ACH3X1_009534 [Trebouxia sp. C0004]
MEAYVKGPEPGEKLQSGIHYQGTLLIDEQGWRRKNVCWLSVYGAPSELHLLLNDSIQAWVAQQQTLNPQLCIFDSPKTLVGALRLDSDAIGSEYITRDIRDHNPALYAACPIKRVTDSESGDAPDRDDGEHSNKEVESYVCTPKNAGTGLVVPDEPGGAPGAICGAAAPADTATDHPDQCEEGAEWMNSHQYLKHIVLSCTSDEVKKTLAALYHVQARSQFMKYKDELLQCLASRTVASGK